MVALINCSYCGKLADPNLKSCPHCRKPMHSTVTPQQAASGKSPKQCPSCDTPIKDGDIICVRCGTNLLTGQKIMQEQTEVVDSRPRVPQSLWGGGVIALAIFGIGILAYVVSRDPLREATQLAQSGNLLEAITKARTALDSDTENLAAHLLLGKLYWRNQDYANAAHSFEEASILAPGNEEAGLLAALTSSKTQQANAINKQIAALRRVTENHPNNQDAWYLLALALGSVGEYVSQEEALKTVIDLGPSTSKPRHYLGVAQILQENYAAADEQLNNAPSTADSGDLIATRGLLAASRGEVIVAAQKLQQALTAGTSINNLARARLGLLYMEQGDYSAALIQLKSAAAKARRSDSIRFYYAVCLQALGRNAEALVKYEEIVQADSKHSPEAALQLTIIYMNQGNLPKAREFSRQAAQLESDMPRLYTAQGLLFAAEGNFAQAQQLYRQAISEDGDYPAAHLENGLLYIAQGAMNEGLQELSRFLQLAGDDARNARIGEIKLLVAQLRQTTQEEIAMGTVGFR